MAAVNVSYYRTLQDALCTEMTTKCGDKVRVFCYLDGGACVEVDFTDGTFEGRALELSAAEAAVFAAAIRGKEVA